MIQILDLQFELFLSQQDIGTRVQEMGKQLAAVFKEKNPLFIGILNGAFIFTADLVRACSIPCETTFVKLASYDGLHSTGRLSIHLDLQQNVQNRHLILVEDIIDTGNTLYHLLPIIKAQQPASITLVSLLVKPTALQYPLVVDYKGFEIPNKFVVGYGLDYKEQGRNLLDIYQLAT